MDVNNENSVLSFGQFRNDLVELQNLRKQRQTLQNTIIETRNRMMFECMRLESECAEIQRREDQFLDRVACSERPASSTTGAAVTLHNGLLDFLLPPTTNNPPSAYDVPSSNGATQQKSSPVMLDDLLQFGSSSSGAQNAPNTTKRLAEDVKPAAGKRIAGKRVKLDGITFEQLREHVSNIESLRNEASGDFQCPVCGHVKKELKSNFIRHLFEHFHDKSYHPYKCPVEECDRSSFRVDVVQRHVVGVHHLELNDALKASIVDEEKKAVLDALTKANK